MKEKLQKISDFEWLLPKTARPGMNVDAKIIANQAILNSLEDTSIEQLTNVAMLPGVVNPVCGMSDMHWGYGLPVGAVGAFDENEGVISAGCTGFDINCGINMIRTNLIYDEIQPKLKELIPALFNAIPVGVGSKGKLRVSPNQLSDAMTEGAKWAISEGYCTEDDAKHTEEKGHMEGADTGKISDLARKRGTPQLGTLGAGNHFVEIQKISDVIDENLCKDWGLFKDQAVIMLHCGSRGFGHQVATDYLKIHEAASKKYDITLPDKQLVCAPVNSKEGQDYFAAMKCAVNYAFVNRLVMTSWIRDTFGKVFNSTWEDLEMKTVYAIAHNICKLEEHIVEGKKQKLYVHRKGATRSYPGVPALIAGSMGTSSYILTGTEKAMTTTFGSTCHGAGRAMSRHAALKKFRGDEVIRELEEKGEVIKGASAKGIAEEAPGAYKDVEDVIDSMDGAGISKKVARMVPLGVLKG